MPLNIESRLEDSFAILELAGQLTVGPALSTLRDDARKLLSSSKLSGLILHVSQITQADSAGLGELTLVYTLATKRGCPIRLVEASPHLRKMLEITHLDGLLPSAADINSAKQEMKHSLAEPRT
ncbi:MAG: STAS domain-containing protein [Acidobacteriaceae bacterium]|nr:STAS domain-containing protein [Acidobacteriaceae bacterium]